MLKKINESSLASLNAYIDYLEAGRDGPFVCRPLQFFRSINCSRVSMEASRVQPIRIMVGSSTKISLEDEKQQLAREMDKASGEAFLNLGRLRDVPQRYHVGGAMSSLEAITVKMCQTSALYGVSSRFPHQSGGQEKYYHFKLIENGFHPSLLWFHPSLKQGQRVVRLERYQAVWNEHDLSRRKQYVDYWADLKLRHLMLGYWKICY